MPPSVKPASSYDPWAVLVYRIEAYGDAVADHATKDAAPPNEREAKEMRMAIAQEDVLAQINKLRSKAT